MLNLDTNILIAFLEGTLSRDEERAMAGQSFGISSIVIWELYSLVRLDQIEMDLEDPELNRDLGRIRTWPINTFVCRHLRQLDFRSDPADELIAATSLAHGVPLMTRDTRMLGSQVVPLALV